MTATEPTGTSRAAADTGRSVPDAEVPVQVHVDETLHVLALSGALDVRSAPDVREDLHAALGRWPGDVVVDLSEVSALDAAGTGVLVGAHRRAQREGRRLVLTQVPPRLARLLAATRLRRVLHVQDAVVDVRTGRTA